MKRIRARISLAIVFLFAAVAAAQQPLPKAETILDGYIAATGGRAAYEKLHSRVTTATMELAGKGLTINLTAYEAAPNKSHVLMEIPGLGKMETGTDGQTFWNLSAVEGPSIKEGDEKAQAMLEAAFNSDLRWRELFKSVNTVGVEEINGQPCYQVELVSNEGIRETRYYDTKTGLLVKNKSIAKTQMGDIPTESLISDYRKVDGVLVPFKTAGKMMGMDMVVTVESIKHNVLIEDSQFKLPDEIKALRAKAGAKGRT